jgi:phospholipase C
LAAASLANAANAGPVSSFVLDDEKRALPSPENSGIEHVVLVAMENRSFDHILGSLPHANGKQAGLTYLDKSGHPHPTYHLTDYQNCALADPDHSYILAVVSSSTAASATVGSRPRQTICSPSDITRQETSVF